MGSMFKLIKPISLQCICVDTANVAVAPEEVVNQVPNQVCIPTLKNNLYSYQSKIS